MFLIYFTLIYFFNYRKFPASMFFFICSFLSYFYYFIFVSMNLPVRQAGLLRRFACPRPNGSSSGRAKKNPAYRQAGKKRPRQTITSRRAFSVIVFCMHECTAFVGLFPDLA